MNNRDFLLLATSLVSGHFSLGQAMADADHWVPQGYVADAPRIKTIQLSTGVDIQYAEQGAASGTPVIFLHGYTDSWHSYENVMRYLPETVHAYAISQRGHGQSSKPETGYSPKDFAEDIAAFMQQLHIRSAIIVGHSMGSLIAQRFAIDHPARIRGLVLAGAIASFSENTDLQEFSIVIDQLKDPVDPAFVTEFQKSTIARPLNWYDLHTYVSESLRVPARVWQAVMKGMITANFLEELKQVRSPAIIIWGDKDAIIPARDQFALAEVIRDSKVITYHGAGHGVHWEEPERFANNLLNFINRVNHP